MKNSVFVLRDGNEESWQVLFNGRVCTPTWNQRGPAEAYLDALKAGTRPPEYPAEGQITAATK